jgi:hypothetical protein
MAGILLGSVDKGVTLIGRRAARCEAAPAGLASPATWRTVMNFVQLTLPDDRPVYINAAHVRFVATDRDGQTEIVLGPSHSILVKEPPERACDLLARG